MRQFVSNVVGLVSISRIGTGIDASPVGDGLRHDHSAGAGSGSGNHRTGSIDR